MGERWGRRRVLLIGMAGYSLGTLLFSSVFYLGLSGELMGIKLLLALLLARALQSSVMSATPPAVLGMTLAISAADQRVQNVSRVTAANTLGQVLGPTLGGVLVVFGLLAPLYAIITLTALAWCVLYWKLPQQVPAQPAPTQAQPVLPLNTTPLHSTNSLRGNPGLVYIITAAALFCAIAMVYQSLGFYFMDLLGKTPQQAAQSAGFAAMTTALVSFVVQFVLIQRLPLTRQQLLISGLTAWVMGLLLLAFANGEEVIYLAMALIGLGMGLSYPTATAAAASSGTQQQQSRNTGLVSAAPALGFILGPLLAALVYPLQPHYPFVSAALLLSGFLLLYGGWRKLFRCP
ncbi:Predicted arabinose efflux permease, MFS family [Marinospirillum alkaliphilum DSM 21637]|uniref:Predicted arabinose efflux permease, MFS family n=2 Tax=Marinospirillum TaxID=64968 RepID=A0A1K1VM16_9GAMM|nr:Predicted arabinose efflux permease, MFS family [Marinospirillum alkaliphilum DSM 21637]